jgi:hypothetical protein
MHQTQGPIYIKKTLMPLTAQIDANTVIVGDLNIPLSPIDRPSRQKINKEPWLISTEHFTHQQGNTHSFLQLVELSPKLIIF